MNIKLLLVLSLLITFGLIACSPGPESPRGFSLPEGDIVKGEQVFLKYKCLSCHSLEGFKDDSISKEFDSPIPLGTTSSLVTTYAQLVTSVINPSHKLAPRAIKLQRVSNPDGSSKMAVFNDVMTVSELIDLVTFLQPKYKVKPIQYTHYGQYRIP